MCENPGSISKTSMQRLEHKLRAGTQKGRGELRVDDNYAYFRGKSIQKEVWRRQALEMGLPADTYFDIAALARNEAGKHTIKYKGQNYLVEVNGAVQSEHGLHREIMSVTQYES